MRFKWIDAGKPAIILAPMEGVTDAPMRAFLTERGGFHFCVSEFLRITQSVLPARCYFEHVPELKAGCKTPTGVPVQIQLLGGDEEKMALSAKKVCDLGATGIDLNFGCPAPTVNRHDGGAAILRHPERIQKIVAAVRTAVPAHIPVSAKLRLGWESMDDIFVNAEKAALGGASWITIHARTKTQGYRPPAHWRYIGQVRKQLQIPVIANGEIWTREDFLRCQEETGCIHYMIGRGALGDPALPHEMARELGIAFEKNSQYPVGTQPQDWLPLLTRFAEINGPTVANQTLARIKQWLKFALIRQNLPWFETVKKAKNIEEFFELLKNV